MVEFFDQATRRDGKFAQYDDRIISALQAGKEKFEKYGEFIKETPIYCDELSQYRNGGASRIERKPVQLVVLMQESKAKEGRRRRRAVIGELPLSSSQVTC